LINDLRRNTVLDSLIKWDGEFGEPMAKRQLMLSVRVTEEEKKRVKKLANDLKRKHRYLKESDVLRELIGFEDTGLITAEIRKSLQSEAIQVDPIPAAPPIHSESPHIPTDPHRQYPTAPNIPNRKKGAIK
jgi:hypothetical protein